MLRRGACCVRVVSIAGSSSVAARNSSSASTELATTTNANAQNQLLRHAAAAAWTLEPSLLQGGYFDVDAVLKYITANSGGSPLHPGSADNVGGLVTPGVVSDAVMLRVVAQHPPASLLDTRGLCLTGPASGTQGGDQADTSASREEPTPCSSSSCELDHQKLGATEPTTELQSKEADLAAATADAAATVVSDSSVYDAEGPEECTTVQRDISERWGLSLGRDMVLLDLIPLSAVARAGLPSNIRITHLNETPVHTFDEVKAVLSNCIEEVRIGYTKLNPENPAVTPESATATVSDSADNWALDSTAAAEASTTSALESELAGKTVELVGRVQEKMGGDEEAWSAWAQDSDPQVEPPATPVPANAAAEGDGKARRMTDEDLERSLHGLPPLPSPSPSTFTVGRATGLPGSTGGFFPIAARSKEQRDKIELMRRSRVRRSLPSRFSPEEIRRKALALQKGAEGIQSLALNGRVVCFTGTLFMRREDARLRAEAVGARFANSVSGSLDILVVGQKPGAGKLHKATLNEHLDIWNEAQFLRAVGINEQQDLTQEQRTAIARGGLLDDRRFTGRRAAAGLRGASGSDLATSKTFSNVSGGGMVKSKLFGKRSPPVIAPAKRFLEPLGTPSEPTPIRPDLRKKNSNVQYDTFWDPAVPIPECFDDAVEVEALEKTLGGYKLPQAYIDLMEKSGQNGGAPLKCWVKNPRDTVEHWNIDAFFGLSMKAGGIADPERGSQYWIKNKDYPNVGLYFANTHSDGQDMWALDYTVCGSLGEPRVVHVDEASDVPFEITVVANNFSEFLSKLVLVDSQSA